MQTVRIRTCDNISGNGAHDFDYQATLSGADLLSQVCRNLQMPEAKNLRLLLQRADKTSEWIELTPGSPQHLRDYRLDSGNTTLYVLRANVPIAIQTTDGSTKKLLIDITKKVKELVPFIAEKLRAGNSVGYSLFSIDPDNKNNHIPLDLELSLPQQCTNYEVIFFKRRYFVFTKSQIKDRASALLIFNDVRAHIFGRRFTLTSEQEADLWYYSFYAAASNPEDVKPSNIPMNLPAAVRESITNKIQTGPKFQREEAIEHYLTIAHKIEGFGCDMFQVKFAEGYNSKSYLPGILSVGPKKVDIIGIPKNEVLYSFPYIRFVSSTEEKGASVTVKAMNIDGSEIYLSLKAVNTTDIHTIISGYASILRDIGAEVLVDGFEKKDDEGNGNEGNELNFATFSEYFTLKQNGQYSFYPGSIDEYENKVEPSLDGITNYNAKAYSDIGKHLKTLKTNIFNQNSVMNLIYLSNNLINDNGIAATIQPSTVDNAILPVSTVNITTGGLENLLEMTNTILLCQKIIRSEILVKVDSAKKKQIENWVQTLKGNKNFLIESIKKLKESPADGSALYEAQTKMVQIYNSLDNLTRFVDGIIGLSPGSAYLPAIDLYKTQIRDVLRPNVPKEPVERLKHVFLLQQMLFSISIVLAIGSDLKHEPKVNSNGDLFNKLAEAISFLGLVYSKVHETRKILTIRPFSIPIFEKIRAEIIELQHALLNCIGPSQLVFSIAGNKILDQAVHFAKAQIESTIQTLNDLRLEPFREIPTPQQVKQLHDALVETIAKFMTVNLGDTKSKELYEKINLQTLQLKTIVTLLKRSMTNPNRSIFIPVGKTLQILTDAMTRIRELSSILGDASLVHYFNNIIRIINGLLENHIPSYSTFRNCMKEMIDMVRAEANEVGSQQIIMECLRSIQSSPYPDREVASYSEILNIFQHQLQITAQSDQEKFNRISTALNSINLVILCINQLPVRDLVNAPPLVVIPFYKGKDVRSMITEIIPQFEDVARSFKDFKEIPFFSQQKKIVAVMEYWANYFASVSREIGKIGEKENEILIKFKEVAKKRPRITIFCTVVQPFLSDIEAFNKQIASFFSNIDCVVERIMKPHVNARDPQAFVQAIAPKLQNIRQIMQSLPPIKNPELAAKLKQILQLANANIQEMNAQQQQEFADNLYQLIQSVIPLVQTEEALHPLAAVLISLMDALGEFTEFSLKNQHSRSSSRIFSTVVPSPAIQKLFQEVMNDINNIPAKTLQDLEELFERYTMDSDALEPMVRAAAKFIKAYSPKMYPFDALRTLILIQVNKDLRIEQLKAMTVRFSLYAAQLTASLKQIAKQLQTVNNPNQKAVFYTAHLLKSLEEFNPQILFDSRGFPAVALTYNALREIRYVIPLLLREVNNDQNLNQYCLHFLNKLDQTDLSLSLYFSCAVEGILKHCLSFYSLAKNEEKSNKILELIKLLEEPYLLISSNFQNLSILSKTILEVEESILPNITNNKDLFSQQLMNSFNQLKEFKMIIQSWMNPMPDFDPAFFRIQSLSYLILSQDSLERIKMVYDKEILKVPMLFSRPFSFLSSLLNLAEKCKSFIPQFFNKFNVVSQLMKNIQIQFGILCNEDKGYKADLKLQELIPQLCNTINSLIIDITTFNEPNYNNIPTVLTSFSTKQLERICSSMENTPFFGIVKEIIDYVNSLGEELPNSKCMKPFAGIVNLIPTYINTSSTEIEQSLVEAIEEVIKTLSTQGKTVDDLYEVIPKAVSLLSRLLPEMSEKSQKALNVSPVKIMQNLFALLSAKGNDIIKFINPIRSDLTRLSQYLALKKLPDDDLIKRASIQTANLINSISANNRPQASGLSIQLTALHSVLADREMPTDNNKCTLLDNISDVLKILTTEIATIDDKTLVEQRNKLIVELTKDSMKLADTILSSESLSSLLDIRTDKNLMAQGAQFENLRGILAVASNVQLLAYRGIELTLNTSPEFLFEFVHLCFLTMSSLNSYIDTKSIGSLRMFKRYIDNIGDLIDDLSLDGSSFVAPLGFSSQKANFINTCASVVASLAYLNAGFSTSLIPNSFNCVLASEVPKISKRASSLLEIAGSIINANTKKELNTPFANAANSFHTIVANIVGQLQKATDATIMKIEMPLFEALHNLASSANSMSDVVPMNYEPDLVNQLPSKFVLPQVSAVEVGSLRPQETSRTTIAYFQRIDLNVFANYMASNPPNAQLVQQILALYQQMNDALRSLLQVSLCSVNLQNKLNLTSAANSLCNSLTTLNKAIKGKCLASPNWSQDAQNALRDVAEKIKGIIPICEESIKLADTENSALSAIRQKIFAVSGPLLARIAEIEKLKIVVGEMPISPTRELTLTLCNLASSGGNVISNILLHAKDHPKDIKNLDDSLEKGKSLTDLYGRIIQSCNDGNLPEISTLSTFDQQLSEIFGMITQQVDLSKSTEAKQMREQLTIISKGIETLGTTMKQHIDGGNSGDNKEGASQFNSPEARDRLTTRLQLESSVIMYRWKHEFLEKQMTALG